MDDHTVGVRKVKIEGSDDFFLVNEEDYDKVSQYKWKLNPSGYPYTIFTAHSLILEAPDGLEIDHKDRDPLNNTRENLRLATRVQNCRNRGPNSNGTSSYKGLSRHKDSRYPGGFRWQVDINLGDGERVKVGMYPFCEEEQAARDYDSAALYYFGEFAYTNFQDSKPRTIEQIRKDRRNRLKRRTHSKFRGVTWNDRKDGPPKRQRPWKVAVTMNGESRYIGRASTEEEGARMYDEYVRAKGLPRELNFPDKA